MKITKFKVKSAIPHFMRVLLNSLKQNNKYEIECKSIKANLENWLEFAKSTQNEN